MTEEYTIQDLIRDTVLDMAPIRFSVEDQIRQRTEREANMIRVALGYVRAGDSKAAARILEAIGR